MNAELKTRFNPLRDKLAGAALLGHSNHQSFCDSFLEKEESLTALYMSLYRDHPSAQPALHSLFDAIIAAHVDRPLELRKKDEEKERDWFLSNQIAGMSLYVDRFCGNLRKLNKNLDYFEKLGVNLLHLMPIFQSPPEASDGGYAVSDFRKVDERFGSLEDLRNLQSDLLSKGFYLMLDIVLNHTSDQHPWALEAKNGNKKYQDFYYLYPNRIMPDQFDETMPEIFPETAPGNFSFEESMGQWVMTVFHRYQWDLNYRNPEVLTAMVDTIFFYANLGVDILRIDAPAFIWKELGTTSQNLPQAHTLLRLIKLCVGIATPGMALLGEAIVSPGEIMKYFGTDEWLGKECDFAYNATHMALQWDALATGDTRVMYGAQQEILRKPLGTSWITYTRCHDDIGLGYEDYMIRQAGFDPFAHRKFLKDYYSGSYPGSPAMGALFSVNEKTTDARISGSLASLCGLEWAIEHGRKDQVELAVKKIILMQAHSFFLGGVPMLFYGDEAAYTNDYSYLEDPDKNYDNRWMHRPLINWKKNAKIDIPGSIENIVFQATAKLLSIRRKLSVVADRKNLTWLNPQCSELAAYLRAWDDKRVYCLFNFSWKKIHIGWRIFSEHGMRPRRLLNHWTNETIRVKTDASWIELNPYEILLLEPVE